MVYSVRLVKDAPEYAQRQRIEGHILEEALAMARGLEQDRVLVLPQEGWHIGVIGIVASKLVDAFHRPAIVLSIENGVAYGSCRSVPHFDMLGALERCASLFIRFGGHRQAAGLTMEAAVKVERLPQVFAGQGSTYANGATGTATVNLRGLGSSRTLVLVNGRRLPAGSPLIYAADLNQIPAALIKRVEVLTGGASAIYGSDAVAGVVNFVMNDKFTGLMLEANGTFFNHSQQHSDIATIVTNKRKIAADDFFKGMFETALQAGEIIDGTASIEDMGRRIFELVLATASGTKSKSERHGYGQSEFVPWQVGAVM